MKRQNDITDAEWQVMRMIWAGKDTTSSEIITHLGNAKGWSPTTIKTLLARLVKKNIISFNLRDRTRLYYPLLTENDCVRKEMHNVIMRLYGQTVNHESRHFVFYGHNDPEYIKLIATELDKNFLKITNILGMVMNEKIMVYTHRSRLHLHSALGVQNGPDWLRGGWAWGILHIAPKECFDDISAEKVAVHVFTQIIINKLNPATPYWLMQGYSAYMAKWLDKERIRTAVIGYVENSTNASPDNIDSNFERFRDAGGYELAYTVAQFVVLEYDAGRMAWFLKSPHDYEKIFSCSKERFWSKWLDYIKKKYVKGIYYAV